MGGAKKARGPTLLTECGTTDGGAGRNVLQDEAHVKHAHTYLRLRHGDEGSGHGATAFYHFETKRVRKSSLCHSVR